jgi:hypothetical protein
VDLKKEGLAEPDPGRFTATLRIAGHTRRVLRLHREMVEEIVGASFPSPVSPVTEGRERWPTDYGGLSSGKGSGDSGDSGDGDFTAPLPSCGRSVD